MKITFPSDDLQLAGHVGRPAAPTAPGSSVRSGVVLCHGFPSGPGGGRTVGQTYPELADRVAGDLGWVALAFHYRGCGDSEGDFSLGGWLADVHAAVTYLLVEEGVHAVWLAGFGTGGTVAICAAGDDDRVRGVAALAAPSDFANWTGDARRLLDVSRQAGVIRSAGFPADVDGWAREWRDTKPVEWAGKIPPRPMLLVHGSDDEVVPPVEARVLSDAAAGDTELRVVVGAGHRLRHDPRAVAVLLGWLGRQG